MLEGEPHFLLKPRFDILCVHCKKSFTSKALLQKHISTYHSFVYSGEFKCSHCKFGCSTKEDLDEHTEDAHKYVCDECNKTFASASGFQNHRKLLHGSGEHLFTCKTCGKSYGSSSRLKIHAASHSTIQLFQCTICKRKYKYKHGLDHHVRTFHWGKLFVTLPASVTWTGSSCPYFSLRKVFCNTTSFTHMDWIIISVLFMNEISMLM